MHNPPAAHKQSGTADNVAFAAADRDAVAPDASARPRAPEFVLTAVTSGRRVCRAGCAGRPLLLLFHDQDGLAAAKALQDAVRARWPRAEQLLVAGVINLQPIPPFLRSVTETMMGIAFRDSVRLLPPNVDPTDYVLILPDRSGRVSHAFGVLDGGKTPCVLLIDGQWRIGARLVGDALPGRTVAALNTLLATA